MCRYIASIALLLLHIANAVFANDRQPATSVVVASPDEQVAIEVFLEDADLPLESPWRVIMIAADPRRFSAQQN